MGSDKALLSLGGRTIIETLVETLRGDYAPVRIIANATEPLARLGLAVHSDLRPGSGPLGGIHTALATASHEVVLVTACDLPFIHRDFLRGLAGLLAGHDAVVPRYEGRPLPVCAFYSVSCVPALEARLDRDQLKAADFLDDVAVRWVEDEELARLDPEGVALFNLNTPEDYRRAQEIAAGRAASPS
jgi:molybdopterin-guanine dinucleotide biosynthesis protein A